MTCGAEWRTTWSSAARHSARCGHDLAAGAAPGADGRDRRAAGRARRRPAGQTAIRSKPVRITLDLSPELYRQLTRWVDKAAVELGVPRVALADAVRAMIRVTTENPDEVLDRLRRDRER